MAGTALVAANYFILRGAYTTSDCADVTSGLIIDGHCYALEYPSDGWTGSEEDYFSDPIDSDDLTKLTGAYYVSLKELYTNSYTCQNQTGDYGGTMSIDVALAISTSLPTCFYNLPVFALEYTGAGSIPGSPCQILTNNDTACTPEVGVTYMPSNLAEIFTDDFCYCSGGSRECTSL